METTSEHWLPLSEDERRLLQAILYTELDAAEDNVRDFEAPVPNVGAPAVLLAKTMRAGTL
jgi:hypothetical protein